MLERLAKNNGESKEKIDTSSRKFATVEPTERGKPSGTESQTGVGGGDLKSTLAGVINRAAKSSLAPTAEKIHEKVERPLVNDIAEQAREIEQLERELEAKTSHLSAADDPLNPKKIERMMKVPPGTRSPF